MTAITVTIPTNPIPYGRTGGEIAGRRVHTPETRDYLSTVAAFCTQATQRAKVAGIRWPTDARYAVLVLIVRERLDGDVDNVAKAALDGCSSQWAKHGALWKSDARVDDLRVVRCAADRENPRLVIMARTLDRKPSPIEDLEWLRPGPIVIPETVAPIRPRFT